MNLRQLEILAAVIRTHSTIAAAQDLGMSQPAVSNSIKSAEASLGFLLFERVNNRLIPTPEAQVLLGEAEPLFLMRDTVMQTAAYLKAGRKGRIRVAATAELSESLMPQVISRFLTNHLGVEVALETHRLDTVLNYVETGVSDIGFAMEPYPRPSLEQTPLAALDMVCAFSPDSELGKLQFVTPVDLDGMPVIKAGSGSRINKLIEEAFQKSRVVFNPTVDVRFMNVAGYCVEQGVGVAIIDELTASCRQHGTMRVLPFRPRVQISLAAVSAASRPQQRLVKSLVKYARDEVAKRLR
ncbi:LysR family transcriptional regulator [Aliirhizobium smilacinae]|uniref:LysR family transcriptional regulator n=1 Tax=Aliirhizobium smilacinae TaxID=1395944 RepID=A0A5C4XJ15_9HYPH|nr:LysR family transcriptional regulator [Rhizobium smilacinae]TNM63407.1 LysR family transcriptional regulator [Rhizobium smilacinae]